MKIGVMNNPAKSIYDEVISFGKARFDFLDLTIEGPAAMDVDVAKLRPLPAVCLSDPAHSGGLSERIGALRRDLLRPGCRHHEYPPLLFLSAGHAKKSC